MLTRMCLCPDLPIYTSVAPAALLWPRAVGLCSASEFFLFLSRAESSWRGFRDLSLMSEDRSSTRVLIEDNAVGRGVTDVAGPTVPTVPTGPTVAHGTPSPTSDAAMAPNRFQVINRTLCTQWLVQYSPTDNMTASPFMLYHCEAISLLLTALRKKNRASNSLKTGLTGLRAYYPGAQPLCGHPRE